jgi:accessory gene regulator protein AgrB
MKKIWLFRSVLLTLLIGLLCLDLLRSLAFGTPFPQHRNVLLASALLWVASVFFPQKTDDDWQLT